MSIIEIDGLVKKYPSSEKNAVDGISFKVEDGQLFAFLGVNGAGKSTTINIICTLLQKTSGSVKVGGFEIGTDDEKIKKLIGVVFQNSVLDDSLTVRENIKTRAGFYNIAEGAFEERIKYLVETLDMSDFIDRRYGKLSGGQRRKSDIARALITNPKILFLDEPTTGLDPASRIKLWQVIQLLSQREKITVFLTTHYMEEAERADKVAIIDKGKILVLDTPQKLKTRFSNDVMRLTVSDKSSKEVEKLLSDNKFSFVKNVDTYKIDLKDGKDAIEFLPKVKNHIESFEVLKGNMDNVFLNITGRDGNELN